MEWIEPNCNLVDMTEYEMMLKKRKSTEDFVIKFFKNWESNNITDKLVVICKDLVTDQRLQRIVNKAFTYLSLVNFSQFYRKMCLELFSGEIDTYVTILLAFSIVLDRTMKAQPWYSSSELFTTLIESLVEASFDATNFDWNGGHRDMLKTLKLTMLIISPALIFFYFLYK